MLLFIWNLEEPLDRPVGHSCWLHAVQIDIANHTCMTYIWVKSSISPTSCWTACWGEIKWPHYTHHSGFCESENWGADIPTARVVPWKQDLLQSSFVCDLLLKSSRNHKARPHSLGKLESFPGERMNSRDSWLEPLLRVPISCALPFLPYGL